MKSIYLIFISFLSLHGLAQTDSIKYIGTSGMNDGIYVSYQDFRKNKSISKEQIVSSEDKTQQEFIGRVLFAEKFSYLSNGAEITQESKKIWGYFQNNTCYVNYQGDFYRVPVFGSISYLVANVTVISPGFYDPRFGSMGGGTSKELREFVMDFYDGNPIEFTMTRVEELLARDSTLFEEYKKLGRRKQKEQIYRYIRKYNEQHPVYFLN